MTLEKAREILREQHALELVDIYHESDLVTPHHWIAATVGGLVEAEGRTWGEVFASVTGEAPI